MGDGDASAAIELLGHGFAGTERRQLCWAHLIRNITAIAERTGASGEIGAELLNLASPRAPLWKERSVMVCAVVRLDP